MTARWTHGRSTRHDGAVCGADDGASPRITDEPHLVTCPECPDAAANETIPDDAATGDPHIITTLREAKPGIPARSTASSWTPPPHTPS